MQQAAHDGLQPLALQRAISCDRDRCGTPSAVVGRCAGGGAGAGAPSCGIADRPS